MCVPAIGRGAMERASLGALQLTLACLIAASPSAFGDRRAELWAAPPREAGDEPSEAAGWSFEALVRPSIPDASHAARVRQPIDAFVFRKLEKRGLEPAPEASPRVLLRRLWFDLAGLPPSEEELERFVRDPTEAAYERTVDLLLASPRFGSASRVIGSTSHASRRHPATSGTRRRRSRGGTATGSSVPSTRISRSRTSSRSSSPETRSRAATNRPSSPRASCASERGTMSRTIRTRTDTSDSTTSFMQRRPRS